MKEETRLSFPGIALRNLKRKPFRSVCLTALTAALAFVLFGGSLIIYSLENGVEGLAGRLGADILILPSGYDNTVEGILLRGEPSACYMDAGWTEKIAAVEGVEAVSPQLFVASLVSSCCSMPVQLIGFRQDTDFVIAPWIKTSLPADLAGDEIVVGGAIISNPGERLTFFGRQYRIAAKMENTGTGFDASVFMNMEAARQARDDYAAKSGDPLLPEDTISSIIVRVKEGFSGNGVTAAINKEFGYGRSGIAVLAAKTIISKVSGGLRALSAGVAVFTLILWIMSVFVLALVFSVIVSERKQEFGLLRSLGATRKKLVYLVLVESGTVSLAGGALGIFLSALLILSFRVYIRESINMPYMQPSWSLLLPLMLLSLFIAFATGPLAALWPSLRIGKKDPYAIIRDGGL
ncbi:MAG: ABC transporter permease [Desulfarculales bacterium]|jgi:putative ABC transport system permease protein|nr:ABC transporter permease [Desulfarculales bacterium]